MYLSSKAIIICLLCSICGNQEVTKAFIQIFVYYYLCFENHYTCGEKRQWYNKYSQVKVRSRTLFR